MGRTTRRKVLIALGIVMLMGIALHFRIWTIDYRLSANDAELLRREFDLANREAMDESAEWRRRYDSEADKSAECLRKLEEIEKFPRGAALVSTDLNKKIKMLQKENMDLLERVESLKQELESEKLKCSKVNM
ncbi:uncharacterized protein LOC127251011 [Andrographis paniculata]|uniref:uncharacterized protein LOC127251011 n=1 Tax=Andrographis paniculata TaxID=175694 RepID=UPI0021E99AD9|nr:uncharacterized protein LOC127251011 [Andrographis paniculata]